MLNAVLNHCVPDYWEGDNSYTTKRYHLYELRSGDNEYSTEIRAFSNDSPRVDVLSLQRVQNPFQLGRFIIRREQKQFRNENVTVVKYYHPISKADLTTALEFNMDVRRYSNKLAGAHYDNKNPKFFLSPSSAANILTGISEKVILICNVLSQHDGSTTFKTNDAEYMPIYVATLA